MTQKSGLRLLAIIAAATLSACGTTSTPPPPPVVIDLPPQVAPPVDPVEEPVIDEAVGLVPPHMEGRQTARVAILLPFSSENSGARAESLRLLRAAELALFERAGSNLLLIPKDTQGTTEGARAAAMAAFEDGADLILGPLFGQSVTVVGQIARRADIPVIAFSTDTDTAGNGVYLLSFPPELEVARVVDYASRRGVERFAYLGPQSRYGMAVNNALRTNAELTGASLTREAFYTGDVEAMASASSRLARGVFEPITPEEALELRRSEWVPNADAPFQAVMLPEGSTRLRTLGPLLISQAVDPLIVRFLGTGLWNDEDLLREPALHGGWFAGPDRASHQRFEDSYEAAYGSEASNIASLGYDAVALAAHLEGGELGFSREAIEDPEGFLGIDGLFRFSHSGVIERGLAIYEVQSNGFREIEPAPQTFDPLAY
ncbi:penicillin-binding protein activator [Maricaulis sp.]|uniref:penicillin-binding protein activator n=1 Tax=Maricaulis sp. TaxID=1486257 RepID=UPI003A919E04